MSSSPFDVVPALLVVSPGRVVVDPDHVGDVAVELGVQLRLEDVVEDAETQGAVPISNRLRC